MDRRHELTILRRSIAMLTPGTQAPIERDEALRLLDELTDVQRRLERLRSGLRALVDEDR